MTSILPALLTLYLPESEQEAVKNAAHAIGLEVVQAFTELDQFDSTKLSKERTHCIISHPTLPYEDLSNILNSNELNIRWCLLASKGAPFDSIKNAFQHHSFLNGVISAETSALLHMGVRLNTHVYPKIELLKLIDQAGFFEDFTTEEKDNLIHSTSAYGFTAGETILDTSDPTDFFFILLKGKVETLIFDNPDFPTIISVAEGDPFGEVAVIDKAPRSGLCLAADESIVLKISAQVLNLKNSIIPRKIYKQLAKTLAHRLRSMNSLLLDARSYINEQSTPKAIPKIKPKENKEESTQKTSVKVAKKKQKESTKKSHKKEKEEQEDKPPNPFATPTGAADTLLDTIKSQEEYDVLKRKIQLRTDFIISKIPNSVIDAINNKLFGYLTGSKLAKVNPHELWDAEWFSGGSPHLLRALHMVVCCREGSKLFDKAYLQLPFSQRVVGLLQRGCAGTFLGSQEAIDRYLQGKNQAEAVQHDFEIPIDRIWEGDDCIEFLTHSNKDVRTDTLFFVFDEEDGKTTREVREAFPSHQIITVVSGFNFKKEDPLTIFNAPEDILNEKDSFPRKSAYKKKGFYQGETFFLADFSPLFKGSPALEGKAGAFFATMGILAHLGPDYSGLIWGSKGGAEGAVRAARAKFGIKGAQSAQDLADAVNWADQ